uniref:Uncharacterized protein n=1 Tax=Anguilla anguilla TaxID=7936 RepID=A0A0E9UA73_ANGAN
MRSCNRPGIRKPLFSLWCSRKPSARDPRAHISNPCHELLVPETGKTTVFSDDKN